MTHRLWVALVASVAICIQNSQALMGFTWAIIHGAGPAALLAFTYAAIGLGLLWAGYVLVGRTKVRRGTLVFSIYAAALLALNELVVPATPLETWREQRALDAVEVRNIRDEPILSARGNPIGVRITFEAVFPRSVRAMVSASTMAPVLTDAPWPLTFGRMLKHVVEPPPTPDDSPYDLYRAGIVYTVTQDMVPNFLFYSDRSGPCLMNVTTNYVSEADVQAALATSRDVTLRTSIQVSAETVPVNIVAAEYETSRRYDLEAMRRSVDTEGNGQCVS